MRALRDFGRRLGLKAVAQDRSALLDAALTHDSYAYEHATGAQVQAVSNERLEFLGDAVLGLIVATYVYETFETEPEGKLSTRRAALVSREALARTAQRLDLGSLLRLGKGEAAAHGEGRPRTLAAAFEAIVGAVYVAEGLQAANDFVRRVHIESIDAADGRREVDRSKVDRSNVRDDLSVTDARTALQEFTQAKFKKRPTYVVTGETGPAHGKSFTAEVRVRGKVAGTGSGPTKKQAQARAAAEALKRLRS